MIHQNLILTFGTKPLSGLQAGSSMIQEITEAFENNWNKDDLTLKLPSVFNEIVTKDAKLEIVTKNTLAPLSLIFSHNFVSKKIAYIFVNSGCKNIPYSNYR